MLLTLNRIYVSVYHKLTLATPVSIPVDGPAIIAPTHTSVLDPLLIQSVTRRRIHWMMAAEYMRIPLTGPFWRAVRIIPVERNGKDSAATRAALRILKDGGLIGIFPEGRISPVPGQRLPLTAGTVRLAAYAKVPIYPIRITGPITCNGPSHMIRPLILPQRATLEFASPVSGEDEQELGTALATALSSLPRNV
jgi:1-acyl-sn-glycerol-3-phosphate acyltransferase